MRLYRGIVKGRQRQLKTQGTGIWFTSSLDVAKTYSDDIEIWELDESLDLQGVQINCKQKGWNEINTDAVARKYKDFDIIIFKDIVDVGPLVLKYAKKDDRPVKENLKDFTADTIVVNNKDCIERVQLMKVESISKNKNQYLKEEACEVQKEELNKIRKVLEGKGIKVSKGFYEGSNEVPLLLIQKRWRYLVSYSPKTKKFSLMGFHGQQCTDVDQTQLVSYISELKEGKKIHKVNRQGMIWNFNEEDDVDLNESEDAAYKKAKNSIKTGKQKFVKRLGVASDGKVDAKSYQDFLSKELGRKVNFHTSGSKMFWELTEDEFEQDNVYITTLAYNIDYVPYGRNFDKIRIEITSPRNQKVFNTDCWKKNVRAYRSNVAANADSTSIELANIIMPLWNKTKFQGIQSGEIYKSAIMKVKADGEYYNLGSTLDLERVESLGNMLKRESRVSNVVVESSNDVAKRVRINFNYKNYKVEILAMIAQFICQVEMRMVDSSESFKEDIKMDVKNWKNKKGIKEARTIYGRKAYLGFSDSQKSTAMHYFINFLEDLEREAMNSYLDRGVRIFGRDAVKGVSGAFRGLEFTLNYEASDEYVYTIEVRNPADDMIQDQWKGKSMPEFKEDMQELKYEYFPMKAGRYPDEEE